MKIGIIIIATRGYTGFVDDLLTSFRKHFLLGHQRRFYIFTDAPHSFRDPDCYAFPVDLSWPEIVLRRYHLFVSIAHHLCQEDVVFHVDADMRAIRPLDDADVLPSPDQPLCAVLHQGGWIDGRPDWTPLALFERSPRSKACVLQEKTEYYQGCLFGGLSAQFLEMASALASNIDADEQSGSRAVWMDESHLNWWLQTHPHRALSRGCAQPEAVRGWWWADTKILHVDKDPALLRGIDKALPHSRALPAGPRARKAEKLILKSNLPPGDILMLTAAVRDLHRRYPDRFLTDVRTNFPEIWSNNPYVTPLQDSDPSAELIDCRYPLIDSSNHVPSHFLQGFTDFLNKRLNLDIELTEFNGDIHLSEQELASPSPLQTLGFEGEYWIIVSGGKRDYTIKWWDVSRYQQVVDHFQNRVQFVQVGALGDFHPELKGVIDLRGKTTLRELILLVYHSAGVVCPVTSVMHLAAAVPTKVPNRLRPCVVIAGGREPPHWEAYPGHQFIHTIGMLPCCRIGGCWRSRTKPLPDRSPFNRPQHLCVDVVNNLPRCMDMISATDVIRRVQMSLDGEARFPALVREERRRMGLPEHLCDQLGRINVRPTSGRVQRIHLLDDRDILLRHYRAATESAKRPLIQDLTNHALTNIPQGLGDTILLTQLPAVAARQGKQRYITSENPTFKLLTKFNSHYQPALDRTRIAANLLQQQYQLGNGHLIQRLQRAFQLTPELVPKGHIETRSSMKSGRVVLHLRAGSPHVAWQRVFVHPRAREVYPQSRRILQQYIDAHPEMSFVQIGIDPVPLSGVEDFIGRGLEETIRCISECEYFIGIVSGPMHLAAALGLKSCIILNFPPAAEIFLPTLKDIDLIESEWLYPQNVHLHQEDEGPLVKRLTLRNLERAMNGELYPYWVQDYLPLILESL